MYENIGEDIYCKIGDVFDVKFTTEHHLLLSNDKIVGFVSHNNYMRLLQDYFPSFHKIWAEVNA